VGKDQAGGRAESRHLHIYGRVDGGRGVRELRMVGWISLSKNFDLH
jgi:hypothetical protein